MKGNSAWKMWDFQCNLLLAFYVQLMGPVQTEPGLRHISVCLVGLYTLDKVIRCVLLLPPCICDEMNLFANHIWIWWSNIYTSMIRRQCQVEPGKGELLINSFLKKMSPSLRPWNQYIRGPSWKMAVNGLIRKKHQANGQMLNKCLLIRVYFIPNKQTFTQCWVNVGSVS